MAWNYAENSERSYEEVLISPGPLMCSRRTHQEVRSFLMVDEYWSIPSHRQELTNTFATSIAAVKIILQRSQLLWEIITFFCKNLFIIQMEGKYGIPGKASLDRSNLLNNCQCVAVYTIV